MIRVGEDFEEEYPGAEARATECFANLVKTGDLLIGLHDKQSWEDHRLSSTARMALAVIEGSGGPLEPSVIAERLIITSGSMTSILDTLEKRELVHRGPHQEDRRKVLVTVTDEGRAILDAILPSLHQRERRVISEALTPQEQNRLLELLAKVQLAARDAADLPPDRTARRRKPQGS